MADPRSLGAAALAAALVLFAPLGAQAAPGLDVEVSSSLGSNGTHGTGWSTLLVRLRNRAGLPIEGYVELHGVRSWRSAASVALARAPFSIGAGSRVLVELPVHGVGEGMHSAKLQVLSASEKKLLELDVEPASGGPLLFDWTNPSRVVATLQGSAVIDYDTSLGRGPQAQLSVSSALVDAETGELRLPERAAGYAPATLVLVPSAELVRRKASELDALGNWLLSGGALAITVSRPEDLLHPVLQALVGGSVRPDRAPSMLRSPCAFEVAPPPGSGSTYGSIVQLMKSPSPATAAELAGFRGGNLRASPWGASATYGLGEVHLLAFDPSRAPFAEDEWVHLKVVDLVHHALSRRQSLALRHGAHPVDRSSLEPVRRILDPNEGARWTVAISTLLLLTYAVVAGPVSFFRAARKGAPFRALLSLPLYAALTFGAVVAFGVFGRGIDGQARRLAFVDAGAGMARASITKFRGLYEPRAGERTVWSTDRRSVLGAADEDGTSRLVVDRDGPRIDRLQTKPWQITIVSESGFAELGGGVSLVPAGTDLVIANRTARDLVSVVVSIDGLRFFYLPRVAHGASVKASSGRPLSAPSFPIRVREFESELDEQGKGLHRSWEAIESMSRSPSLFPDDTPSLLAELEGGEGALEDSGLRVDVDRMLVRVVGTGGLP